MAITKQNARNIGNGRVTTHGYVIFYRPHLRYGFIRSHVGIDYFFHGKNIAWGSSIQPFKLRFGQVVSFSAAPLDLRGPQALVVQITTNKVDRAALLAIDKKQVIE